MDNSLQQSQAPHEPDAITFYNHLARITAQMQTAAEQANWEDTLMYGQRYIQEVELLRSKKVKLIMKQEHRETCSRLLRDILRNDAAVRDAVSPEMKRLSLLLSTRNKQKQMLQAYRGIQRQAR
ncbi:MAG: flagellar protein FliT [Alcaligenaceae bacterium]|nr:flagellar protein FliT [Alcaligenaceae bacterium]